MAYSYTEGHNEILLVAPSGVANIGTLIPPAPPGTTTTAVITFTPGTVAVSGVVSMYTAGTRISPKIDVKELGTAPWGASFVIQGGDALCASANSAEPVKLDVTWIVQQNVESWVCPGCRVLQPAGILSCRSCRTPKPH